MRFADPDALVDMLNLLPGARVADFGAGSGACTFAAARRVGSKGVVYAIEIQQELVRKIKNEAHARSYESVETVWGDIDVPQGTGLPDKALDTVIVSNVLFLTEDKPAVAREAARVLKQNGRVLVVDWTDSFGGMGPAPDAVVSEEAARALFSAEGFVIGEHISAGAHHWGFIGKKP